MGLHKLKFSTVGTAVVERQVSKDADPAAQLHVVGHDGVVHLAAHAVQENVDAGYGR